MSERVAIPQDPNISGIVTQVNERGVQLAGHEQWFNISKFLKAPIDLPTIGEHVTMHLNPGGWILAITREMNAPVPNRETHQASRAEWQAIPEEPSTATLKAAALRRIDAQLGNPDALLRLRCLELTSLLIANGEGMPLTHEAFFTLAEKIERWARGGAA